jgi:cyclic-di-GMP phosphodiesterase TipF (flagellum assembly factor)
MAAKRKTTASMASQNMAMKTRLSFPKRMGKLTLSLLGLLIATALAGLALISIQAALIALAVTALGSLFMMDYRRRARWEAAAAYRIHALDKAVEKNVQETNALRSEQKATACSLDHLKTRIDLNAPMGSPMPGRQPDPQILMPEPTAAAKPTSQTRAPFAPRAVRPGAPDRSFDIFDEAPETSARESLDDDKPIFSRSLVQSLIHNAIRAKRVDVFVQPIVRLPQRKTRFYEVFARIRAGAGLYLQADEYMELARSEELMPEIDTLLLMESLSIIQRSAHIDRAAPFFINVTTETLGNVAFMRRLLGFLTANRDLAPRLVFEIQQADFEDLKPAMLEIARGLARLGCTFSMDNTHRFDFDIKRLQILNVRFVKIPAQAMLKALARDSDFVTLRRAKTQLESNGIGVIAEKVESEIMLKKLLDYDLNYGQGYLFGKPDLQGAYKERKSA